MDIRRLSHGVPGRSAARHVMLHDLLRRPVLKLASPVCRHEGTQERPLHSGSIAAGGRCRVPYVADRSTPHRHGTWTLLDGCSLVHGI